MAAAAPEPRSGSGDVVFSVIVPTFNRAALLNRCLEALARQSFPSAGFEVLVCDDGSSDGTEDVVKRFAAPFRLTYLRQENAGPASARNLGIREACGKYLLIINDDTLLEADAMERHHRAQLDNHGKRIAVLGTFSLPPEVTATPLGYVLQNSDVLFDYPNMQHGSLYGFDHFYTCNISILREAVLEVGLFDEDYTGPAAEDLDLGYRLGKRGFGVLFRSDCKAWHLHEISPAAFCRTHALRGHGAMTFVSKHPEVPFYPGLNDAVVKRWRAEAVSLQSEVEAIVEGLASEACVLDDSDEVARRANEIFPLVRTLMVASVRRGILGHPAVHDLAGGRRGMGGSVASDSGTGAGSPTTDLLPTPLRPPRDGPKMLVHEAENRGLMAPDARVTF